MSEGTTQIDFVNRNGQRVIRKSSLPGNDQQYVYVLRCGHCGNEYGANGSDVWQKLCPICQEGKTDVPSR